VFSIPHLFDTRRLGPEAHVGDPISMSFSPRTARGSLGSSSTNSQRWSGRCGTESWDVSIRAASDAHRIDRSAGGRTRLHVAIPALVTACVTALVLGCGSRPPPAASAPSAPQLTVDDDGPADFTSINDAIRAAATGTIIRVRAGTYHELVELRSGIAIVGAGRASTTIEYLRGDAVVHGDHVSGARLHGLRLQHEIGQVPCGSPVVMVRESSEVTIEDCEILGSGYEGVLLDQVTGARIDGSRIAQNVSAGVEVLRSTHVVLTHDELAGNGVELAVGGSAVAVSDCIFSGTHLSVVAMPIPSHDTEVALARSHFAAPVWDFMARAGDSHVRVSHSECTATPFIERRELTSPALDDTWTASTLEDPFHNTLLGLQSAPVAAESSRLSAQRGCDGEPYVPPATPTGTATSTPPPSTTAPTAAAPTMIDPALAGTWVGGSETGETEYELTLTPQVDRLDATLAMSGGMSFECAAAVDRGVTSLGRLLAFTCHDTEDEGLEVVTYCAVALTGGRVVARSAGTPRCELEGVNFARR
jgi:hypothetical protein